MAPQPGAGVEPTPSDTGKIVATSRTDAAKAVWVKILKEWVAALEKEVQPSVRAGLEPGEQTTAVMPDGTRIGKVSLTEVPEVVVITDEAALLAWVQEHRPDEIIPTIRESFLTYLKDQVKKHGYAHTPEGEIIPGIELVAGTPRFTPTPNDEGRRLVKAFLADLSYRSGVLALPSAEAA